MADEFCLKMPDFHVTFGYLLHGRKCTKWDKRLYFPSEGRRTEDFFALKNLGFWPGLNPRTWVPKASTLPLDYWSRFIYLSVTPPFIYAQIFSCLKIFCTKLFFFFDIFLLSLTYFIPTCFFYQVFKKSYIAQWTQTMNLSISVQLLSLSDRSVITQMLKFIPEFCEMKCWMN